MAGFVRIGKEVWCCPLKYYWQPTLILISSCFSLSHQRAKATRVSIQPQALSVATKGEKTEVIKSDTALPCFNNENGPWLSHLGFPGKKILMETAAGGEEKQVLVFYFFPMREKG
jgi:hypothetical protein